jgi:hypothetical protein
MKIQIAKYIVLVIATTVAACSTTENQRPVKITKQAQSDEVRSATLVGVAFPPDCKSIPRTFPAGKTTFNVSYREPGSDQNGKSAKLAYTTIYLRSPNGLTRAIRIQSKDPEGGAYVQVLDIPLSGSELELCVTATNLFGKESLSAWEAAR